MAQKYKVCIIIKPAFARYSLPILWSSAKTYFEENSKYSPHWQWIPPVITFEGVDEVLEDIIAQNPTVIGISLYIWNEIFSHALAEKLKERLPNSVIVMGGPQSDVKYNQEFFRQNSYVDVVIPGDAYGELSLNNILENVTENNGQLNTDTLTYAYFPDQDKNVQFNALSPKKKDFKWPNNLYRAQQDTLIPLIQNFSKEQGSLWITIETSRGCPYKCSFCDWGGGTYTKTVKKPFAYVMDEIAWVGENKIDAIYFTDANFGMFNIDIEYAKKCVSVSKQYGYPKQIYIQPTKVKLHNLFEIYRVLAEGDMLAHYQISIQDLDDNVKKNVDRIDFSFEEQIAMFKRLQKIKYLPVFIECILGLPGSSIATIKDSIQRISLEKLPFPIGHHWILLPETPAYHPDFREKFKLKTIKGKSSDGIGAISIIKQKEDKDHDPGVNVSRTSSYELSTEYVVGSFSYTTEDWIEMNQLQVFVASMQQTEILNLVADYMWNEHDIKYGDFFHTCLRTVLDDPTVDIILKHDFEKLRESLNDWLAGHKDDVYIDYHEDFKFMLSPVIYYIFISLTHIDEFFDAVKLSIAKLITVDDKILDLCDFSRNRLLDITYRPGRKFTTRYDWPKYFNTNELEATTKTYEISDTEILAGGKWFDIDWAQYEGTINYYMHYIYRACYDYRSKKTANQIKETND
jgi:putative methyltransferase